MLLRVVIISFITLLVLLGEDGDSFSCKAERN